MAYKNQFPLELSGKITYIGPDDYITIGDDEKLKIVAIIEAEGENEEGDEVEFAMWGEKAEKLAAVEVGARVRLKGNIKSRWIDRKDGQGQFSATEITCWYLEELREEKRGTNYKKEANERRAGGRDAAQGDAGKRQAGGQRGSNERNETPKREDGRAERTGSGRTPRR